MGSHRFWRLWHDNGLPISDKKLRRRDSLPWIEKMADILPWLEGKSHELGRQDYYGLICIISHPGIPIDHHE